MSSSGVLVNPDCCTEFEKITNKREIRYLIFKIENNEISVERSVKHTDLPSGGGDTHEDNSKAAYDAFVTDLKSVTDNLSDCRYAVFDFQFAVSRQGVDGKSKMDKIIFIQLCPDSASIKKKMVYASSASAIKTALGTDKILAFQISDESELSHKEILQKLLTKFHS